MVRLSKIYTRTGDKGQTRLVGGQQVPKDSLRIEAYGTIDELNAILGMARTANRNTADVALKNAVDQFLRKTQNDLFNLGSDLATKIEDRWEGQPLISNDDTLALEKQMDAWNADLEPLNSFVLPGGNEVCSLLHLGRTVCRRAERILVATANVETLGEEVIPYVNRLSDTLFVMGRWLTHQCGEEEPLWEK